MHIAVFVLVAVIGPTLGQFGPFGRKSGQCPPLPTVGVCDMTCYADVQCVGVEKCCRTACGGTICIGPVTERVATFDEKPGYCPNNPRSPWVCSNRCTVDADCRGKKKCCKNRCGALACLNPEEEVSNDVF